MFAKSLKLVSRKILNLILVVLLLLSLKGQGQTIGIANSNYATTNAMMLNPSATADALNNFEYQIFGLNISVRNNFLYLPKGTFSIVNPLEITLLDNFSPETKYAAHAELDIVFPAFTKVIGKNGFGFFLRSRAYVNAHNVPGNLAKFIKEGFGYNRLHDEPYEAGNFQAKSMSWSEIGFNYSRIAYQRGQHMVTAGGSIKLLRGWHNAGIFFRDADYEVIDTDVIINRFEGNYGVAMPSMPGIGSGLGIDFGFTYKKTLRSVGFYVPHSPMTACEERPYDFKIAFSVLDVGAISFTTGTRLRAFEDVQTTWANYPETPVQTFNDFDTEILERLGYHKLVDFENTFTALLPTTFVLEIDKKMRKHLYINTTAIAGLRYRKNLGVSRGSLFAFTPRLEYPNFGFDLPITMHTYKSPNIGYTIRWRGFYIGTNNIFPYIGIMDTYGIDLHFGFKKIIKKNKTCASILKQKTKWWCPKCKDKDLTY